MDLRNVKNEIIKEKGVYTIKTETTFSDCVVGDGIILALSKEREQLIKYTTDFDIISVEPINYVSMQEYRFKKHLFLVFETNSFATKAVIMMSKGKAERIELWMTKPGSSCDTIDEIKGIYQVHPKKYIIITTERDGYERSNIIYQDIVAEIDISERRTKKMFTLESNKYCRYVYEYKSCPRFIFSYYDMDICTVYDLHTGFCYKMPDSSVKSKEDIVECYSLKAVIVLQINQKYYLYVNGYLVYQYTSEEYERILYNLKNKLTSHAYKLEYSKIEYFYTLPIGKSLCIWKKNEKPEMITL